MKKLIILRTMEGRSKVHQYKDHEVWSTARVLDYPEIDVDLVFEIHKKQNNHYSGRQEYPKRNQPELCF